MIVLQIPLTRFDSGRDLEAPRRMRSGDAAADLPTALTIKLMPGERATVPTGFGVALPSGWCGLVLPRSGLAHKHGITVVNGPGLIDSGYRGEIKVILLNTSDEVFIAERGQRIAQLAVAPVPDWGFLEVDELPDSTDTRGAQGFGSSG